MRFVTAIACIWASLAAAPAFAEFQAEDQTASGKFTTAGEIKPIIEMTKGNWIAVREFNGQDLLYVTHLAAWRCGMHEIRVGVNGAAPTPWALPECQEDMASPNAIPDDGATMIYKGFPLGSIEKISVEILFDDMTESAAEFDRKGVQIN